MEYSDDFEQESSRTQSIQNTKIAADTCTAERTDEIEAEQLIMINVAAQSVEQR